ncbi:MAG: rod shape-determining protein [Neisseriaceae bacterium]|jgi:rod shape-determining protein MreB|nr:MAG: rod shape-determining protein [Neisseriaceae bacterium]
MFKKILSWFSADIAIDLGTANTIVYMNGKGIIVDEPSMVALSIDRNSMTKKILAVGQEAKIMLGKTPGQIEVIRPMKDGVIADFHVTEQMIKYFIKKASDKVKVFSVPPTIVICVPCGSTQVERRAIKDSALAAGARKVELIEEAMAAALGAGLPVESPQASMVVDIGGGTTEVGVVSLGGLVYADSIRIAGDRIDEVISNHIRSKHGLLIGDATAEDIKKRIGSAHKNADVGEMKIRGRSVYDGLPKEVSINSSEVREALHDSLEQIIGAVKKALESTPPELAADLIESGIVLTGGGALLNGLPELISDATQLNVIVAEEPLLCVAKGCGMALDYLSSNKVYFNRLK